MEAKAGTTDSGRWQRLDEIFAAAFKAEPGGRQQLLEELCDGDEQLRKEVEEILAATHNAAAQGFLEADVFADGARLMAGNEIAPGTEIGSYRIVREIGRGGMGAVYLAERDGFHQQVALKIIKRGMDTDEILSRFRQERWSAMFLPLSIIQTLPGCSMAARPRMACLLSRWNMWKARSSPPTAITSD